VQIRTYIPLFIHSQIDLKRSFYLVCIAIFEIFCNNVKASSTLRHCNLKTELYFFSQATKPSRKWSFSKTLYKPAEFENAGFAFSAWTENILKWKLFVNDDVTIIVTFLG